ncbi:TOMM precursor leader peptide-binding protein [Nonomuraea sp. NPDC050202]|uniref:TOMM precursor leader peptide-binding protein n=1 Tax=Nonomuraea sp. NPDC050202 TaxID=3155035 RepID=UPI0033FAF658
MSEHAVTVLAAGRIADAVADRLGVRPVPLPEEHLPAAPTVAATDGWSEAVTAELRARLTGPVLPARAEPDTIVIGPWETPGEPGCALCAVRRQTWAAPRYERGEAVRERHAEQLAAPSPLLTADAVRLAAALIADDIRSFAGGERPRTRATVLTVDLHDLSVTPHRILPDPLCEVCAPRVIDEPPAVLGTPRPVPSHAEGAARGRDLAAELDALTETYVDERTGVVWLLHDRTSGGAILSSAEVSHRWGRGSGGYGRAPQRRVSRTIALLEALERFSAAPGRLRSPEVGSYHDLAGRALDPRTLGLHPPEAYDEPGFGFDPFDPDRAYRWVWGWSFLRGEPILVPETLAYYGAHALDPDNRPFVYEISNGCALGSSLEEAVLYGMLEIAERDGFLLTWYARLPVPEIDQATLDERNALHLAALRAETGYDLRLFDITAEHGIPAVWALATAAPGADLPAAFCTAGAHLSGRRAVMNAVAELGDMLTNGIQSFTSPEVRARAAAMAEDSSAVADMEDHPLLYTDPRAAERLNFLTASTPGRPASEVGARTEEFAAGDLGELMRAVVGRYTDSGLDVVVVDQTPDELRAMDLHAVKVLIPGTLPMTFGHRHRRMSGLPRLLEAPRRLGYTRRSLTEDELNTEPHPFP